MSDRHRFPYDPGLEPAEPSREVLTPRGGFMARPGLKRPPRHAVVVRVGDAPATDDIPVARGSKPPPEPGPTSQDDKVTLRGIPTPCSLPAVAEVEPAAPAVIESVPPPSDTPVVASVRGAAPASPQAGRRSGNTIAIAAAAGIVLGLGSVAVNRWAGEAPPPVTASGSLHEAVEPAQPAAAPLASSAPAPSHSALPASGSAAPAAPPKATRRTIF